MTANAQATETPSEGLYSYLDLLERNECLQEELKVCRQQIEELEAEVARLTGQLKIAEKNELLASREARALRNYPAHSQPKDQTQA
jgi:cell division protein FtsB